MGEGPEHYRKNFLKRVFTEVGQLLIQYFKNPVKGVRHLPDWNWWTILLVQTSLSSFCGIFAGIANQSLTSILLGMIFYPISSLVCLFSISGFLFYTFKFFYKIEVDPRKLYTLSVFASLPFLIAVIFSPFFRPISIVGLGFSGWLVYLGSIAHFQIPRKSLGRILLVLFSLYLLFWASNLFNRTKKEDAFRKMATPESLDILENELKEE